MPNKESRFASVWFSKYEFQTSKSVRLPQVNRRVPTETRVWRHLLRSKFQFETTMEDTTEAFHAFINQRLTFRNTTITIVYAKSCPQWDAKFTRFWPRWSVTEWIDRWKSLFTTSWSLPSKEVSSFNFSHPPTRGDSRQPLPTNKWVPHSLMEDSLGKLLYGSIPNKYANLAGAVASSLWGSGYTLTTNWLSSAFDFWTIDVRSAEI